MYNLHANNKLYICKLKLFLTNFILYTARILLHTMHVMQSTDFIAYNICNTKHKFYCMWCMHVKHKPYCIWNKLFAHITCKILYYIGFNSIVANHYLLHLAYYISKASMSCKVSAFVFAYNYIIKSLIHTKNLSDQFFIWSLQVSSSGPEPCHTTGFSSFSTCHYACLFLAPVCFFRHCFTDCRPDFDFITILWKSKLL